MSRVAFAALALVACEPKPAAGEAIADVCRVDRSGQTVTVSGYLQVPPLFFGCHEKDCSFQLTTKRKDTYEMDFVVPLGTGPSTMTPLPPRKSQSFGSPNVLPVEEVPFELRDASGRRIAIRDFVRVTGTLTASERSGKLACEIRATKLERL